MFRGILMGMKMEIRNFGPINEAKIDIGKINVIAGPNASGKTTSSKLFYCLLASVSSDGNFLINRSIANALERPLFELRRKFQDNEEIRSQIRNISVRLYDSDSNLDVIEEIYKYWDDFNFSINQKEKIEKIFEMTKDNRLMFEETLNTLLKSEFKGKKFPVDNFKDSTVTLLGEQICDFKVKISTIEDDFDIDYNFDNLKCFEVNEVSFFETPYIFDLDQSFRRGSNYNHQQFLIMKLKDQKDMNVFDRKLNENITKFQKKIEKIIKGKLRFDISSKDFIFEQNGKSFLSKNTASGIKSLGIIQILLENRKLPENSYLIMDEPEVHLHPEWQIKFARILVLLARDLNVTLYINSHSPQFIEAIAAYSEYYDINDVNFYLAEKNEDESFNFNKIENKLHKIYMDLGDPYDIIDEINGKNLSKKLKGRKIERQ